MYWQAAHDQRPTWFTSSSTNLNKYLAWSNSVSQSWVDMCAACRSILKWNSYHIWICKYFVKLIADNDFIFDVILEYIETCVFVYWLPHFAPATFGWFSSQLANALLDTCIINRAYVTLFPVHRCIHASAVVVQHYHILIWNNCQDCQRFHHEYYHKASNS